MSSSKSRTATSQTTNDNRVAADNGAMGVSGGGDVNVHVVADEAFDMGIEALAEMRDLAVNAMISSDSAAAMVGDTLSTAMAAQLEALKTEEGQLSSQIIKIGIPAAAIAFVAAQVWGK
jgi:hypothetical protein